MTVFVFELRYSVVSESSYLLSSQVLKRRQVCSRCEYVFTISVGKKRVSLSIALIRSILFGRILLQGQTVHEDLLSFLGSGAGLI